MRKIDNATFKSLEEMNAKLELLGEQSEELLEVINDKLADFINETIHKDSGLTLIEMLDEFRDTKEQLTDLVNESVGEMESYYDDRSEKWQDGDRGEAYSEWISEWKYVVYLSEESCIEIKAPDTDDIVGSGLQFDIGVSEAFELPNNAPEI